MKIATGTIITQYVKEMSPKYRLTQVDLSEEVDDR